MAYERIMISSGHGKKIRGASGVIDEVDEARYVVDAVADKLRVRGVDVEVYHDDISDDQTENLNRIVDAHNYTERDLDISVHFNAFEQTSKPMGTEVWYVTQAELADNLSAAMAKAGGLIDRGPKKTNDLFFLNNTEMPAVLLEVVFVDSSADAALYKDNFNQITDAIADTLAGEPPERPTAPPVDPEPGTPRLIGKCSHFGGPDDQGVSASEGLAFIFDVDDAPHLFLPEQPPGTTGLARRLNPYTHYIACRFDYNVTSKKELLNKRVWVKSLRTGVKLQAQPADWGPNETTGRVADLSPSLMADLELETDDDVEVTWVTD
jgi:N-acetylmuramoyl-L-alanine amidase